MLGGKIFKDWKYEDKKLNVIVLRSGNAWFIKYIPKILGSFGIKARVGFEVDNALRVGSGEQLWYLVPGYELRALATSSSIPGKIY